MASIASICISSFPQTKKPLSFSRHSMTLNTVSSPPSLAVSTTSFTWDDVLGVCQSSNGGLNGVLTDTSPSYLQGFQKRIRSCNRDSEKKSDFFPFFVEQQIVGYIHKNFAEHLRKFKDVFTFVEDGVYVTLHASLGSPDDRTFAVGYVIERLLGNGLIPGIRNEAYPVTSSYGMPICFSLERAAAPFFGVKTYGVLVHGYVERDGEKFMWVGKRSDVKPTWAGRLDHVAAGGIPHNVSCGLNAMKECEEEAGIPRSISKAAIPVGAISFLDIDEYRYKREVLFCYDLKLSDGFVPYNQDGEVESFKLIPVKHVAKIIQSTDFFRPTASVAITDFLFRHGFIRPDQRGYLELLESLKSGDCS